MDKAATWLTRKWRAWAATAAGRAVNRLLVVLGAAVLLGWLLRLVGRSLFGGRIPYLSIHPDTLANALALVAVTLLAWRLWEKRSLRALGLQNDRFTLPDLAFGFGAVAFSALFIGLVLGYLTPLRALLSLPAIVGAFVSAALLAFSEEIFFRRYVFENARDAGGSLWWGVGLSALLFALYRGGSLALFVTDLLAGVVLCYTVISSRQLWTALGMQLAWHMLVRVMVSGDSSGVVEFAALALTAVTAFAYLQILTDRYWRIKLHEPD